MLWYPTLKPPKKTMHPDFAYVSPKERGLLHARGRIVPAWHGRQEACEGAMGMAFPLGTTKAGGRLSCELL